MEIRAWPSASTKIPYNNPIYFFQRSRLVECLRDTDGRDGLRSPELCRCRKVNRVRGVSCSFKFQLMRSSVASTYLHKMYYVWILGNRDRGSNCRFVFWFCSWFFGKISRREAEKLLMSEENPRGTYLIRNSEQNPGSFSLSVKDWEQDKSYHVKHYKIRPLDSGGYFITTRLLFQSLRELVQSYSSKILILS